MNRKLTILWFTFVFLLFLALAVYSFRSRPLFLVLSEILIPVLYAFTVIVYTRSLKPVALIKNSLSLLKEGDFSITLSPAQNQAVDDIINVYNAMIMKLRQERLSVREKNHFLDLLIESSPLGIIITDLDERISHINKAAFRFLALAPGDYKGQHLADLGSIVTIELGRLEYDKKQMIALPDGQKFLCRKHYFMDNGFRHPFYLIEEFTEEIRKAEKEAYGKLIRMMAHEVNNTIGSVNSIMSTVQSSVGTFPSDDKDEIDRALGVAIQRNYQLNRFMQNLSKLVRLPPPDRNRMDLCLSVNLVLDSFSAILRDNNISLETSIPQDPIFIYADRSQMEQVFANIVRNSVEAVEPGGMITVSVIPDPLSLKIGDDGVGLSNDGNEPVFTPFFSAKPGGQGIGLTLVHEILENHGYSFSLKNRPVRGAEFTIYFTK